MEFQTQSNDKSNIAAVENLKSLQDNWNYSRFRCDSSEPASTQDKSLTNGQKSSFAGNKSTSANSSFNALPTQQRGKSIRHSGTFGKQETRPEMNSNDPKFSTPQAVRQQSQLAVTISDEYGPSFIQHEQLKEEQPPSPHQHNKVNSLSILNKSKSLQFKQGIQNISNTEETVTYSHESLMKNSAVQAVNATPPQPRRNRKSKQFDHKIAQPQDQNGIKDISKNAYNEVQPNPVKIIIVGNERVGKTSIINRYCLDMFDAYTKETTIIDHRIVTKKVPEQSCTIKMQLWDTAGQEVFRSLNRLYYRGCVACILVYDLSQLDPNKSEEQLDLWLKEFIENCGQTGSNPSDLSPYGGSPLQDGMYFNQPENFESSLQNVSFIVLGNKFDKVRELAGERGDDWQNLIKIMENRINSWCQHQHEKFGIDIKYSFVSAKSGEGIPVALSELARQICVKRNAWMSNSDPAFRNSHQAYQNNNLQHSYLAQFQSNATVDKFIKQPNKSSFHKQRNSDQVPNCPMHGLDQSKKQKKGETSPNNTDSFLQVCTCDRRTHFMEAENDLRQSQRQSLIENKRTQSISLTSSHASTRATQHQRKRCCK